MSRGPLLTGLNLAAGRPDETPRARGAVETTIAPAREPGAPPSTEPERRYLFVIDGESSRMVPLPPEGALTLGRGDTADVRLGDTSVSRLHAKLSFTPTRVRIEDLGSQNGTLLNDERVVAARTLASGDVITVSGVTVVYHSSGAADAPQHFLEVAAFRQRVELELERAVKYFRPLSLMTVRVNATSDRARVALALEGRLRRVDQAAWLALDCFAVVLPEATAHDAQQLALKVVEALEAQGEARAGVATCPADGIDLETLLSSAREAAAVAPLRDVALASQAFRTVALGDTSVLVADPVMVRLYALIERLAKSHLPVLVCGETGTGKELAARGLHFQSARRDQPLVTVNCAALQENLLESELFGHEKGAFTGADRAKAGLFETASGGTVFLDELGELSPAIQAKLLRAIESKRITRLGDTRERPIDIRIVAATHRDLKEEVRLGRFRQDLYFRLDGAVLWLPPLRDRKRELPILARAFLSQACARIGRAPMGIGDGAMQALSLHQWPGNVRELRNMMEYVAATVVEDTVEPWHLDARLGRAPARAPAAGEARGVESGETFRPIHEEVQELERTRMLQALHAHGWNQTRAADAIAMPLRTFVTKFKQYDLQRSR